MGDWVTGWLKEILSNPAKHRDMEDESGIRPGCPITLRKAIKDLRK